MVNCSIRASTYHILSLPPPPLALGYSIISPIINGLAVATFGFFYLLYKYLFLWQLDMPPAGDTGGRFFPKAVQHVFVGLYVQQVSRRLMCECGVCADGHVVVVGVFVRAVFPRAG